MLLFQVLTLFPERYDVFFKSGLPGRAIQKNLIQIRPVQLRDFADPERKGRVDDAPYGGGPGMILQIGPIHRALQSLPVKLPVLLLTPSGERLNQRLVRRLHAQAAAGNVKAVGEDLRASDAEVTGGFTLICGFYEGVDHRVAEHLVDREISVGDFILNSGDPAALCLIESISRLVPGFMGCRESAVEESFEEGLEGNHEASFVGAGSDREGRLERYNEKIAGGGDLIDTAGLVEYPQYSRPADFMGWKVPEVLLSGHHGAVREWRKEKRLERTRNRGRYEQ